ncbi:hypothetical protein XFF6166_1040004 [Xanthomonas citri pv. fuscans]|nr:hypothetical protein XFF6166_1040004 [Xanthomonas citri pv. fuscans]SOO00253.1 hypothetical protein XFF6960_280001 [Xanthomonas citri pv. fuscans]SOO01986.1 hypothetical protein XFF7767_1100004 [Xanthomonas citri pv. fuscans]
MSPLHETVVSRICGELIRPSLTTQMMQAPNYLKAVQLIYPRYQKLQETAYLSRYTKCRP